MWFGKRAPRSGSAGRRGLEGPRVECLEHRLLLAIDLGGVTPPSSPVATSPLPTIATVPYGIDMAGGQSSGGAGFSVTDVGDVNGDGFDDFVIGSPTVVNSGGQVTLGTGHNSTAYLVFGSNQVNSGTVDWLTLNNPILRVGDLAQLGNTPGFQTNPINGQPGFAFNGIKFITSQETSSQLGASVAALGAIGGQRAFVLGAPGGTVFGSNTVQGGRAFVIYGGTNLNNLSGATIDLDNLQTNQGINFYSLVTGATGAELGASVAGPGDVFGDQTNDVAIGAPGATYNGNPNAGVAILIDGGALPVPTGPATILVDAVGQNGGTRGVIFGGPNADNRVGAKVGGAGDFNNAISGGNTRIDDFLIGAPDISTTYLVYGGTGLIGLATPVGGLNSINLNRLGAAGTATNTVLGATIVGEPGDGTGFALSTAGDFNADGNDDFLIGSPFFNGNEGRVTLFYGQPGTTNNLFGLVNLDSIPTNDPAIQYLGASAGSLAGYAVSQVGRINLTQNPNPILIGSPGFAGNTGAAYLIPGNISTPVGSFNLSTAESQPVAATQFNFTTPGGPSPPFFGASVSGRLTVSGQTRTADGDLLGDFIIGAPGYAATGSRGLDGGAMILQGALVPVQTPVSTSITTTISVDAPESVPPPYPVNATTPNTIQIFVESVASANFNPVTDINPATIVVNGVAFTAAQVSIAKDPVDENNDGIPDAIITLTPRSALNLNPSVTTLTITGRTLATSPIPNKTFIGTTTIVVTGGPVPGGGGAAGAVPVGFVPPSFFQPPFGPEMFVPKPSTLSAYNYKPIPKRVAYYQFQPDLAFKMRILNYEDPARYHFQATRTRSPNKRGSSFVLKSSTFTHSSVFHPGKQLVFKHSRPVIPTQFQRQNLTPRHH